MQVTLLTRGNAPITQQIPDDDEASYSAYKAAVQHAKADRKDADAMKPALSGQTFDGTALILEASRYCCCRNSYLFKEVVCLAWSLLYVI